jgi:hypothetical protein
MKTSAIASLLAVGQRAWSEPTAENMAEFACLAPIPERELAWILEQAKQDIPGLDEMELRKLELVVRSLWKHFHCGIGTIGVWSEPALLTLMYIEPLKGGVKKTGTRVAENVNNGKFDPLGNDYRTNLCAYLVGHKAAMAALDDGKTKIEPEHYRTARTEVEEEMSVKLDRAGGTERATNASLGFGC